MFDADTDQPVISATASWGSYRVLSSRSRVSRQGDRGQHCYLLLKGVLAQTRMIPTGARQIVGFQVAGDMCGFSAVSNDPLGHDIVALSPVSYLSVSAHWLSDMTQRSAVVKHALWREFGREAAITAEWIANIGQRPAYQRVAHLICEIEARLQNLGLVSGNQFEWYGTQADLGAAVGLSVVHVNKTLRRLADNGIASWGRHVKVHDLAKLHELAGFDPTYLALDRQSLGNVLLSQIGDLRMPPEARGVFHRLGVSSAPPAAFLNGAAG